MTRPLAKRCGCRLDPVADDTLQESDLCSEATQGLPGQGWVIVFCPTHADVTALAESRARLLP